MYTERVMRNPISIRRLARMFSRISKPATASRASERLFRLAQLETDKKHGFVSSRAVAYLALSQALNEHRHVLLAMMRADLSAIGEHTRNRNAAALRANKFGAEQ